MKMEKNRKYTTIAMYACAVIAFGITFACIILNIGTVWSYIGKFLTILNPIIYGFCIAFVINPLIRIFEKKFFSFIKDRTVTDGKGNAIGIRSRRTCRRVLSMLLAYLLVIAVIAVCITMLVPQVIKSYSDLETKMGSYVNGAQKWAEALVNDAEEKGGIISWIVRQVDITRFADNVTEAISNSYDLLHKVSPYIMDFIANLLSSLKNAVIGLIVSVYFLLAKEKLCSQIRKTLFALFSDSHSSSILRVTRKTGASFERFLSGKLLDSLIIGVITFFVLMIFDIPYYPLIAVIVGVTNIIPFFGPFIGAIPSALIILVAEPSKFIWFLLIILIIQQLDGNIIGPKILGGSTGLSALWVVIAITVMGGILGITGMFIGVPIVAVIYSLTAEFISSHLKAKNRAIRTNTYENVLNVEDIPTIEEEAHKIETEIPVIRHIKLSDRLVAFSKSKINKIIRKIFQGRKK